MPKPVDSTHDDISCFHLVIRSKQTSILLTMGWQPYVLPYNTEQERHHILSVCKSHIERYNNHVGETNIEVREEIMNFTTDASFEHVHQTSLLKDKQH